MVSVSTILIAKYWYCVALVFYCISKTLNVNTYITITAIGKKKRDMKKMYDDHLTSIPKLSPRIGFCKVSIILNVQLITKKATI